MSEVPALYRVRVATALPEKRWQAQVEQLAALFGLRAYHTYDSASRKLGVAGFPDLVLAGHGRVIFVELKTDTGRLTPAQRAWLGVLGQCPGVEAYCWRPCQVDAVVAILHGAGPARERARAALVAELG